MLEKRLFMAKVVSIRSKKKNQSALTDTKNVSQKTDRCLEITGNGQILEPGET